MKSLSAWRHAQPQDRLVLYSDSRAPPLAVIRVIAAGVGFGRRPYFHQRQGSFSALVARFKSTSVIFLAYAPIGFFSRWLGAKSRIKERTTKEEGVPVWITGNFERLLAFFLVLFHVEGGYTLLALWLGAKLAASWHRLPTEAYGDTKDDEKREYSRQIRAGTLCALIAGIVSVLIGALAGLVVRSVCQCCVFT